MKIKFPTERSGDTPTANPDIDSQILRELNRLYPETDFSKWTVYSNDVIDQIMMEFHETDRAYKKACNTCDDIQFLMDNFESQSGTGHIMVNETSYDLQEGVIRDRLTLKIGSFPGDIGELIDIYLVKIK